MASSDEKRPNYSRRFFWFALAIAVAIAGYTAAWHYGARILTDRVNQEVAALNRQGTRASCENAEVRGFPFRIGVFCRSVLFEDARAGVSLRAREFRSAAQVYAPLRALGELESPAALTAPGLAALELDWSSLRASARLALPLPQLLSVEGRDLSVRLDEPGDVSPLLWHAGQVEFHMRPVDDDLDVAARFSALVLDPELTGAPTPLPAASGLVDIRLDGGALLGGLDAGLRGRSGIVRSAAISIDGVDSGLTLSGPFSVDAEGLTEGDFQLTLRNPRALADIVLQIVPEMRREVELGVSGLSAMGDAPTLPLRVRAGEISLGFLSLGTIPPL